MKSIDSFLDIGEYPSSCCRKNLNNTIRSRVGYYYLTEFLFLELQLTKDEESALNGAQGEAIATAYRILVAIGEATNAERLVPIRWAHVSGVNYNTIGDAGADFLEKFSQHGRTAVRTTINPMGYDASKPTGISAEFKRVQERIVSAYERMGVLPSFTCTPYEAFDLPDKGSLVSFAESNAAVYSNSLLGLRTNKESALSALASSVTGKAPLSDLRLDDFRKPKISIKSTFGFSSELDYGLLGYFAGKVVEDSCVSLSGIGTPSIIEAKALSAGIGTSGACSMFTLDNEADEEISFDKTQASQVMDELNTAESGQVIAIGSPQLGIKELELLSQLAGGKKFKKRCMIFCSRSIHAQAKKAGLITEIEKTGAEIFCDSCTCLTPYVNKNEFDSVVTNSVKAAYYFNNSTKVAVALKDFRSIAQEELV
jgi:predicted aconitase